MDLNFIQRTKYARARDRIPPFSIPQKSRFAKVRVGKPSQQTQFVDVESKVKKGWMRYEMFVFGIPA